MLMYWHFITFKLHVYIFFSTGHHAYTKNNQGISNGYTRTEQGKYDEGGTKVHQ